MARANSFCGRRRATNLLAQLQVNVVAERPLKISSKPLALLTLAPPQPELFQGFVKVQFAPEFDVQAAAPEALLPLEAKSLPEDLRTKPKTGEPEPLAFQFHGTAYSLPLAVAFVDPEAHQVVLRDFKLTGNLSDQKATFVLTANAHVANPKGGSLTLLSGHIALTELPAHPDWRVVSHGGRLTLLFDKAGDFPLQFKFNAGVTQDEGWNTLDFHVAPSALQPIVLQGLAADTQFDFSGAARPDRTGNDFTSYLPPGRRGETFLENRRSGSRGQTLLLGGNSRADQRRAGARGAIRTARRQSHAGRTRQGNPATARRGRGHSCAGRTSRRLARRAGRKCR